MARHFTKFGGHAFKDKDGTELVPGHWYNFGGNVSWRYTGSFRHTLYARTDADGKVRKPSGPASHDAMSAALYYGKPSLGYGRFIGGLFPADVQGNGYY